MKAVLLIPLAMMCMLLSGCPCGPDTPGQLTPLSGPFGYGVTGPWDFAGTLTKDSLDSPTWTLEGTFTFPTSGYYVLLPQVQVMESMPEQVRIRISVLGPPPGQAVLPVLTPVPVNLSLQASNEAVFDIRFVETCLVP